MKLEEKEKLAEKERKTVEVIRALKKVNYPGYSRDIISFGFLKKVDFDEDGNLKVVLEIPVQKDEVIEEIRRRSEEVLKEISWVKNLDLDVRKKSVFERMEIPIKGKSIAIYSTKGGVGKSTVAVNLAYAFSLLGKKASLLDLDVHGPSVPLMTGTEFYEPFSPDGKHIMPIERSGVKIMSLGFMAKGDTPVVWRGPMVSKAFDTLVFSTLWPETEILVMDMPPGSGDIQLTLAQKAKISAMVMVTTPQEVALQDVRRGISMFRKLEVEILGVIENMSWFECDSCGKKHFIFGKGGAEKIAKEYGIEVLGQIPIDPELMSMSDKGEIFVLKSNGGRTEKTKKAILDIAKRILEKLELLPSSSS